MSFRHRAAIVGIGEVQYVRGSLRSPVELSRVRVAPERLEIGMPVEVELEAVAPGIALPSFWESR